MCIKGLENGERHPCWLLAWYSYDLSDRLLSFREEAKDQSSSRYVSYEYDKNNNATGLREVIDGVAYRTSFQYNEDNTIKSITINSGANFQYFHDEKGLPSRVVSTLNPNMVQNPTFASGLDSWVNVRGMSIEDGGLFGNNAARGIGYSMLRQYHPNLEEGIYTLSAYVKVVNNPVGRFPWQYDNKAGTFQRRRPFPDEDFNNTYELDRLVRIMEKGTTFPSTPNL